MDFSSSSWSSKPLSLIKFMNKLFVILSCALCVACQSANLVPLPTSPEWKKIGEVYNDECPRLHRDFASSQIEARIVPSYPASELWVKSDKADLCGVTFNGWRKSPKTELWW